MHKLRVRMYRQGLGDSFLLTYWADEGQASAPTHLLIDSGVLKGTDDAVAKMKAVAENIRDETGGHVDILVSTHEHWDHLSGFLQAQDVWDGITFGEVWLAWTEDPHDELAQELRRRKANQLNGLVAAAKLAQGVTADRLDALLGFEGDLGAGATATTAKALDWVKAREATIRYLRPGEQYFDVAPLPGIRVYVLGPPHDSRLIKRSDPSAKASEVYELAAGGGSQQGFFAASQALAAGETPQTQPFDPYFRVEEAAAGKDAFFKEHYYADADEWRRIDHDWLGYATELALQLDSDTNNTSLALAFELASKGDVLLFPGDAQVGNWLSWQALEWDLKDAADTRTVRADDLLAATVLYKVGHHASHNATLREQGLELMASGQLTAMIPVNRVTAQKMQWLMPFPPLHKRLVEKTNGRVIDAETGLDDAKPFELSDAAWNQFLARTDVQPGWADYTLEW